MGTDDAVGMIVVGDNAEEGTELVGLAGNSVLVGAGVTTGLGVTPHAARNRLKDDAPHNFIKSRRVR